MVKGKDTNDDNISTGGDSSKPTKSSDYDKLQSQKPNQDVKKDVYIDGETEESFKYKIKCIERSKSIDKLSLDALPLVHETSYYFVSYSHYDYKNVYKDILRLQREGLSIWYDRGLPPGQDWGKVAKGKISDFNCKGVIFYLSENALKSNAIHEEIEYVKKSGKSFLSINLPIEDKESGSSEVKSAIDILEIVQPNISHDDHKWKVVKETFNSRVTYLKYSDSPEQKCEQILKLKRQELLSYRILDDDDVAVSAINDINATSIEIPANWTDKLGKERKVVGIDNCAFANCRKLENVVLNCESVNIGKFAFYNCWLLETPDWEKVNEIYEYAFSGCSRLSSITIPNKAVIIDTGAFENCSGLTVVTWPKCISDIGNSAFSGCTGLTSITIPNSVRSIGQQAFYGCSGLTSIAIPDSVTSIGDSAFYDCSGLTRVTISDSVTSMVYRAFSGCSGLTSITIPDSVTTIEFGAFYGCSGLTSITIGSGVTSIGRYAFYNCSGLDSITIPDSVTSIGWWAFQNCSGLTSIAIPDSVTSIGEWAFSGCSGLTSIAIPSNVTSIGKRAFDCCSGLTSITVDKDNKTYRSAGNCIIETATQTLIAGCKNSTIPTDGSATSIGWGAFHNCSGLTRVTIPNSVTIIIDSAFYGCSGLTSITIPNSVTSIGTYAFFGCSGLTSITIPNSVTSIGDGAFGFCSGLTSIAIPDSVTRIGVRAFCCCGGLTSITIPNSVTSIGNEAFSGCDGLTSITIPSSVTSIGDGAFGFCSGLTSITVDIDNKKYYNASNCIMETATKTLIVWCNNSTIPTDGSVTSIGTYAFFGCSGLTSITIPDSVTRIGFGAFKDCDGLTSITIGSGVTSISGFAFAGCTKLVTINCEAESQPSGWDKGWKDSCDNATVVWGYTGK